MSDRIPFSIPGSLAPWVDTDHAVGVLGVAGEIVRVYGVVTDAPSGGVASFDIRDATAGGGSGFSISIADGETYKSQTGSLDISAAEVVYIRPTAANGALNLSGWFEFEAVGVTGVDTFLTTLSRVKTDEGIGVTTWDAQLSRLIQGVSAQMQSWMRRTIVDTTYTDEVHSGNGWTDALILKHRPITSTTTMIVKVSDTVLAAANYTQGANEGIVYREDASWTSGTRNLKVTYSAGYTAVPEDLAMACTAQVRHEFHQSKQDAGRLGIESKATADGGSTTYTPVGLLPSTIEAMRPYRRLV